MQVQRARVRSHARAARHVCMVCVKRALCHAPARIDAAINHMTSACGKCREHERRWSHARAATCAATHACMRQACSVRAGSCARREAERRRARQGALHRCARTNNRMCSEQKVFANKKVFGTNFSVRTETEPKYFFMFGGFLHDHLAVAPRSRRVGRARRASDDARGAPRRAHDESRTQSAAKNATSCSPLATMVGQI